MTVEELVYGRITADDGIASSLAAFNGRPAVFLQKAPDDTAAGWERGAGKYPRCEYIVDMAADPERHSSGIVSVHIYCSAEGRKQPEDIEPLVRNLLSGAILPADGRTYAASWSRTDMFEMDDSMTPGTMVNGASIQFLLIAFPDQCTIGPDPAGGMQDFLKQLAPEAFVIGADKTGEAFMPGRENPAFYARISDYHTEYETFALRWVQCSIAIHVIAPEPEDRAAWARYLADMLNAAGKVILRDGSPMLVREISVENSADYLVKGQVLAGCLYSIPVFGKYAHPVNHAFLDSKGGSGNNGKA